MTLVFKCSMNSRVKVVYVTPQLNPDLCSFSTSSLFDSTLHKAMQMHKAPPLVSLDDMQRLAPCASYPDITWSFRQKVKESSVECGLKWDTNQDTGLLVEGCVDVREPPTHPQPPPFKELSCFVNYTCSARLKLK